MNISLEEMAKLLEAEVLQGKNGNREIRGAFTSDLLSDVMANAEEGEALITIQAHKNSIAVAALYGAPCVIICSNRPVPDDMVQAAAQEGVAVIRSPLNQFRASGLLYRHFTPAE